MPIALVAMDAGCVCFPDDREQALCAQHFRRSEPLGSFEVVRYLTDDDIEHEKHTTWAGGGWID